MAAAYQILNEIESLNAYERIAEEAEVETELDDAGEGEGAGVEVSGLDETLSGGTVQPIVQPSTVQPIDIKQQSSPVAPQEDSVPDIK